MAYDASILSPLAALIQSGQGGDLLKLLSPAAALGGGSAGNSAGGLLGALSPGLALAQAGGGGNGNAMPSGLVGALGGGLLGQAAQNMRMRQQAIDGAVQQGDGNTGAPNPLNYMAPQGAQAPQAPNNAQFFNGQGMSNQNLDQRLMLIKRLQAMQLGQPQQ
ncbi:MAG: hypothetical protein KGN37_17375 [Burkholderiales bacterium]|nr:hypothetical protein [Burkholderiales bacterium]